MYKIHNNKSAVSPEKNQFNGFHKYKSKFKRDCTKNMSYMDSKEGAMNLKVRIVIPEYLQTFLSENQQFIKKIEENNKTKIGFSNGSDIKVVTCEGVKGALTNVSGKLDNVMKSMQDIFLEIMALEHQINGKRQI